MDMSVITRDLLAERLADWVQSTDGEMSMVAARDEVKWFFDILATSLANGDEVRIHGFGTFKTTERPLGWDATRAPGRPSRSPPAEWHASQRAAPWRRR
jgi:hypothetical protein